MSLRDKASMIFGAVVLVAVGYVVTVLLFSLEKPACVSVPYGLGERPDCVIRQIR